MGKDDCSSGSGLLLNLKRAVPIWPPGSSGSVPIATGQCGSAKIWLKSYPPIRLADLTALRYNTYVQNYGQGGFLSAPLTLLINFGTDTTIDDELYFVPDYQDGTYSGPNQGEVTLNTWQEWDARVGGWISVTEGEFMTLAEYIQLHPNAQIINAEGHSGFLFNLFWQYWIGYIGYLLIGISGNNKVIRV
ncbi:MAG: hypothetical protein K0Q77_333 [Anaerosporomusa subterranea]|jgi:hypothetical protein|nr:hypothetical protein [Anaerosporomusa subterranea]